MSLGPDFRGLIKEAGWNQRTLSRKLGYHESWLSKIVNKKRDMKLSEFRSICEITGIPPHRLLGLELPGTQTDEERLVEELSKVLSPNVMEMLMKKWNEKNNALRE